MSATWPLVARYWAMAGTSVAEGTGVEAGEEEGEEEPCASMWTDNLARVVAARGEMYCV
jgi:hypothetical protein